MADRLDQADSPVLASILIFAGLLGVMFIIGPLAALGRPDAMLGVGAIEVMPRKVLMLYDSRDEQSGLVLSYMNGTIHPYYCLSLAPAVAGAFAIGVAESWAKRSTWFGRVGLAVLIGSTGVWSWWILGRNAQWLPALRWTILAMIVAAIAVLLFSLAAPERRRLARMPDPLPL